MQKTGEKIDLLEKNIYGTESKLWTRIKRRLSEKEEEEKKKKKNFQEFALASMNSSGQLHQASDAWRAVKREFLWLPLTKSRPIHMCPFSSDFLFNKIPQGIITSCLVSLFLLHLFGST